MWKPVEFEDIKVGDRLMVTDKWGTFDYGAVRRKGEISLSFDGVTISMTNPGAARAHRLQNRHRRSIRATDRRNSP
jgi:hypothetical protein